MWAVMLMRRAWEEGQGFQNMMGIMCGLLEHGQKTHGEMLSNGLPCAECAAAAVSDSYQRFLALWMLQTCSAKAGNV